MDLRFQRQDETLTRLRRVTAFGQELDEAHRAETAKRRVLERAGIHRALKADTPVPGYRSTS